MIAHYSWALITSKKPLIGCAKARRKVIPPINIEQTHENGLRISLAVAGFSMEDLDIEVENNQLTIRGKQIETEEDLERIYIHRGIAARQFQRSFVLG